MSSMENFESVGGTLKTFGAIQDPQQAAAVQTAVAPPAPQGTAMPESIVGANPMQTGGNVRESKSVQRDMLDSETGESPFMVVEMGGEELPIYSKEYSSALTTQRCVADRGMLLRYMFDTERKYNVTLSFPAYGVDPIVFEEEAAARVRDAEAQAQSNGSEEPDPNDLPGGPSVVEVHHDDAVSFYEKILVDGVLYFSCIMECLNPEYMHSIIREATEEIYTHGQYMYTLVGPRPLTAMLENGEVLKEPVPLIETLKLNTYEMNLLIKYMSAISGVTCTHGVFDGRQAILFKR